MGDYVKLSGGLRAYLVKPQAPNGRGIVLGMSVWGLNPDLLEWANLLADLGYVTIAPNLYSHCTSDHAIEYDFSRFGEIMPLMNATTDEMGVRYLAIAAEALRNLEGVSNVSVVGWCFGGRVASLALLQGRFASGVAFYPTALETELERMSELKIPLSIHLPEIEQYETRQQSIPLIVDTLRSQKNIETFVYPGTHHGFGFGPPHQSHHPYAARLAMVRAVLFLQRCSCSA